MFGILIACRTSNISQTHLNQTEAVSLILKGATFYLSPITIPLALFVMFQNIVIIMNYSVDRVKFVPTMYTGIALADILKAQGQIVLSVISICVYRGYYAEDNSDGRISILFKSVTYYQVTALPGINCSKLFNLVLAIVLTAKIVNPFRTINTDRLKKITLLLSCVIISLHICDAVVMNLYESKWSTVISEGMNRFYLFVCAIFEDPGMLTALARACMPKACGGDVLPIYVGGVFAYFILPPTAVLICMLIQVRYLRKNLPECEAADNGPPQAARHVSITVFLISTLFFICNTIFCISFPIYNHFHEQEWDPSLSRQFYIIQGVLIGLSEFTLPLIYSALYPLILIYRKPELRDRFAAHYRGIISCCRRVE